jgi:antitoxin component of MazEF toxin-antitoxin module
MSTTKLKVARIGNSHGIRLPVAMLRKYHITKSVVAEEKAEGIVLRPRRSAPEKLSWADTAKEMAAAAEDWSEWENATASDGLNGL